MDDVSVDPAAEFRAFLAMWLETTGWTQMSLAHRTGIGQSVISRWLKPVSDEKPPQPIDKQLRKLASTVNRPFMELMVMAGRAERPSGTPISDDPAELAALMADVRAGWHVADPNSRIIAARVTRAAFHVPRTRRRRSESADT